MEKKKIITRVIAVAVFAALFGIMLIKVYKVISWKDTYGDYLSSTQQLYATPKDTMEIVFVGSSHCYGGIDPNVFWTEYGIPAFNMSISSQDKDSSVHDLKELLKTQSPRVVVIDTYAILWDRQEDIGNTYRNMLSLNWGKNSNDLVKDYVDEEEQKDYILRWPIVHTRYKELRKFDFVQYEPSVFGRGFNYNFAVNPISFDRSVLGMQEKEEISEKNLKWLQELESMAVENQFDLLFIQIPSVVSEDEQRIINGFTEKASEDGVPFIDLNLHVDEIGLNEETDFIDYNHVNYYGAQKVTAYMAEYLVQNYNLESHQFEEGYELWNQNAEYAYRRLWQEQVNALEQIPYLEEVLHQSGTTVLLSLDGITQCNNTDWNEVLAPLLPYEDEYDFNNGGTWIIEDGQLLDMREWQDETLWAKDVSKTNTLSIQRKQLGDYWYSYAYRNDERLYEEWSGLTAVVYDEMRDEIVSTRVFY